MVALVNIFRALAEKRIDIVPQVQVSGGGGGGTDGLVAMVMSQLVTNGNGRRHPASVEAKTGEEKEEK